jgi:hypothetical protein
MTRSTIPWLVSALLILGGIGFAQEARAPVEKPERVTVMRKDSSSVSGELIKATPAGVTVRPRPMADPVSIAWGDIRRVNNGLRRATVVAEYREKYPQQLCDICKGDGGTKCDNCRGTAVEPSTAANCPTCKGSGIVGNCPKGLDGKMACPADCLKPGDFTGAKDANGKRWKTIKTRTGSVKVSDAHIGEIVVIEATGPVMKGKCPTCEGKTRVVCAQCQGGGRKACEACNASGKKGPACTKCEEGMLRCEPCLATGMKTDRSR